MGHSCSGDQAVLRVATLNFSGINNNRFEFHDGSQFFDDLNAKYRLIQEREFPEMKQWKGVLFDKNYKSHRFTVLFGDELIQSLKGKLFSSHDFRILWMQYFREAQMKGAFYNNHKPTEEQIEDVLKMDYAFYRAVVMVVYSYRTLEDLDRRLPMQNSQQLKQFLIRIKELPPFQLEAKQRLVETYYTVIDVMFLQEAGSVKWNKHRQYTMIQNHDSLILYKTDVFGAPDHEATDKWKERLDINHDSVIVFTQNNYLLISTHFKSSPKEYLPQTEQFVKALNDVLREHPKASSLKIIAGMDANHFVQKIELGRKCYLAPDSSLKSTSIKKRTFIQAQLSKADQAINEVKDQIVSTLPIAEYWLELVNGEDSSRELLPNKKHPYDHFIVKAELRIDGCW